jgi:23S rRNA (uracil1939-C5)-methyltransferase
VAEVVTIESLGHRGDGVACGPNGPVYVPFALPGERIAIERAGNRGRIVELIEPSRYRAASICRHFGSCGGCALQMLPLEGTHELKRGFVAAALARQGVEAEVAPTIGVATSSRRRAVLSAARAGRRLLLGYNERLSHRIVDIEECPVLTPPLAAAITPLRSLLEELVPGRRPARVTVVLTRGGLDVSLEGVPAPPSSRTPGIARLAQSCGLARVSVAGEPMVTLAEATIDVSGVPLVPPPGAFVQASAEAEKIMAELVVKNLAGAPRAADLFSGLGTFAFALAKLMPVRAVESSRAALDALARAASRASGLKKIDAERRDLFAFPLAPAELSAFGAVVFDPPWGGAEAQAAQLAASTVPRIVAISCNPASFARDARILVEGGYRLQRVVPVDQFVYSAETEVVGLYSRV